MTENNQAAPGRSRRGRTVGAAAGLLAAGLVAGGILAGTLGASAATTDTMTTPSAAASSGSTGTTPGQPPANAKSSTSVRSDEKSVSTDLAAQLTTKAGAAVAGGTVYRVETDAGDAADEVHLTKAGGSLVTVKFDKNLDVTAVEDGMGKGDPAPVGVPQASNGG
ncbi:MAG TPA: hypothetical protein VIM19_20490 [Actinomycetes bacterium]